MSIFARRDDVLELGERLATLIATTTADMEARINMIDTQPAAPLAEFEQRLVVLQTKDGYSFRGLARFTPECVVLSAAERIDVEKPVQLGGEVVVLKPNLSWFQTIIATADSGDQ